MNEISNKIVIDCAYSFAPGTDYICQITSTFENDCSVVKHSSWSDIENKFVLETELEIKGKNNFYNLINAIVDTDRSNSFFYLYFSGMRQGIEIPNVENWQKNFLVFCLGGNEETKESYGKPFLTLEEKTLKKIFSVDDIFAFAELYEEFLSHYDDEPSSIDIQTLLKKYNLTDFDNFEKVLERLIKIKEKEEEERIKNNNNKNNSPEAIKKYDTFFKTHKHKIKIEYPTGGGAIGRGIGKFIAERSIIFFIDYYFRKNKKLPKGEFNISYFSWDSRDIVKKYEDFKGKENRRVIFL